MKAQNLRLGNYVKTDINDDAEVVQVTSLSYLSINEKSEKYFFPIHITDDWLKNFGGHKMLGYNFFIGANKELSIAWNDVNKWYVYVRNKNGGNGSEDDIACIKSDLKYIHELQNLYYILAGTELLTKKQARRIKIRTIEGLQC